MEEFVKDVMELTLHEDETVSESSSFVALDKQTLGIRLCVYIMFGLCV